MLLRTSFGVQDSIEDCQESQHRASNAVPHSQGRNYTRSSAFLGLRQEFPRRELLNGVAGNLLTLRASAPQRARFADTKTGAVLFNESTSLRKVGKLGLTQTGLSERIFTDAIRGRPKIKVKGGSPGAQTVCQVEDSGRGRVAGRILPNGGWDKFHND